MNRLHLKPKLKAKTKFNNQMINVDNKLFKSKFEATRYAELKMLEKNNEISDLKTQVPFIILDEFTDNTGIKHSCVKYYADFTYYRNGVFVIEETKGFTTDVYKLKRKLIIKMIDQMPNTFFYENYLKTRNYC